MEILLVVLYDTPPLTLILSGYLTETLIFHSVYFRENKNVKAGFPHTIGILQFVLNKY